MASVTHRGGSSTLPKLEAIIQQHLKQMERGDTTVHEEAGCGPPTDEEENRWRTMAPTDQGKKRSLTEVLVSRSFYSLSSISMIFMNKSLSKSYHHVIHGDLSLLVLAFQALIALFFLECCRHLKLVAFQRPPLLTLGDAKRWTCLNLFFCAMLITGMGATKMNTIPVAIVSRNITNFGVILGDYFVFKRRPEAIVLALCGIMLIGAIVVAWRHSHMHATSVGCLWMTGNCMSTVGYILCLKMATTTNDGVQLSKCGTIFLNNVLCIVLLLPAAYVMGEVSLFLHTPAIHTSVYASQNIFAGFLTFFFNFALLNCVWQKTERKARSFVKKESS